ncbi:MAG: isoprenylcysteine carboxylmethyltransferase family protein [Planctomycetia bacterium]|nr:isoprenylcysteine carboxylmethyltransferase family protein [Planctomycetia bacterium]
MSRVKVALLSLAMPTMVGGIVFLSAGRMDLPAVWGILGVLTVFCLATAAFADRGMVRERTAPGPGNRDRLTRPIGTVLLFAHWILAGLDARFGWSPIPGEVQFAGVIGYAGALVFVFWAMQSNPFYSSVVRVQSDRGHHVVEAGPYRFVRHPGYTATMLAVFAAGLALGSWIALIPLSVLGVLFVRRTLLEDDMLQRELPGYAEYALRVRSRLVAGVF